MWKWPQTVHVLKWYTLIVDMGVATNSTCVPHKVLAEVVSKYYVRIGSHLFGMWITIFFFEFSKFIYTSLRLPLQLALHEGHVYCLWPLPHLLLVCTTLVHVLFVATSTCTISLYYFSIFTLLKYMYCLLPPHCE